MLACFGNCLYWTACAASLLWVFSVLFVSANAAHPDWTIFAPIAMLGAFIISAWRRGDGVLCAWAMSLLMPMRMPNGNCAPVSR